ncbi:MAG: hypothetical protein Q7S27_05310, partial [Nanoarchaeota archaeon]|nr:hypothetical protein [Nanoarchaeota archaeon]
MKMRKISLVLLVSIFLINTVYALPLCQFASSASASSQNNQGSLAQYATGSPSINTIECSSWSGFGLSWTPSNWDVKGILTLTYPTPVYVSNLTIFGDYDICWSKISMKNSQT